MSILWLWAPNIGLRVLIRINLSQCPVIVQMRRKSTVWMRIFRLWSSDVRLWVFPKFNSLDRHESEQYCDVKSILHL